MTFGWSIAATTCDSRMKRSRKSSSADELGEEGLDRGLPAEQDVLRLVDEAHAAASEHARDAVAGDLTPDVQGAGHAVLLLAAPRRDERAHPNARLATTGKTMVLAGRRLEQSRFSRRTPMAAYALEIVEGPEAGRTIRLTHPVELGRDPEADIALLQDELISRRHVRLTPQNGEVIVEDLDSVNGTFVDGDEIHSPAHLLPDGQLLVGVTVLELKTAEETEAGGTPVRPIPESLAGLRPLPSEPERRRWRGRRSAACPASRSRSRGPTTCRTTSSRASRTRRSSSRCTTRGRSGWRSTRPSRSRCS